MRAPLLLSLDSWFHRLVLSAALVLLPALLLACWPASQARAQATAAPPADTAAVAVTAAPSRDPRPPTPAPERQGLSGMPGAPSDSAWLAMLVVGGVVAATVLNKHGR
jgi:hypothetical protein